MVQIPYLRKSKIDLHIYWANDNEFISRSTTVDRLYMHFSFFSRGFFYTLGNENIMRTLPFDHYMYKNVR